MKKRKVIDWVTMTGRDISNAIDYIPANMARGKQLHAVKHYPTRFEIEPGGQLSIGADEKQGFMFQFTGSQCTALRDSGISPFDTMLLLSGYDLKATRIDYAVDIFENVNPDELHKHWLRGMVNTSIKSNPSRYHETDGSGYTCYYGAKKSDKLIRVYDKASEMKLLNEAWVRVEYQTRKKIAEAFRNDMETDGMIAAGDAAIKRLLDFRVCLWWSQAIDGETSDHTRVPRKVDAWKVWLDTQVMPAITRRADESEANREWLKDWLAKAINSVYSDVALSASVTSDKD